MKEMKLEWWDGKNPLVINPEIDLPGYHHGLLIVCNAISSYDTITIFTIDTKTRHIFSYGTF